MEDNSPIDEASRMNDSDSEGHCSDDEDYAGDDAIVVMIAPMETVVAGDLPQLPQPRESPLTQPPDSHSLCDAALKPPRTFDEFIDDEIVTRLKTKTWRHMEMCFKWRLVHEYLQEKDLLGDASLMKELRHMLRANELQNVVYDGSKIQKLNHRDM